MQTLAFHLDSHSFICTLDLYNFFFLFHSDSINSFQTLQIRALRLYVVILIMYVQWLFYCCILLKKNLHITNDWRVFNLFLFLTMTNYVHSLSRCENVGKIVRNYVVCKYVCISYFQRFIRGRNKERSWKRGRESYLVLELTYTYVSSIIYKDSLPAWYRHAYFTNYDCTKYVFDSCH